MSPHHPTLTSSRSSATRMATVVLIFLVAAGLGGVLTPSPALAFPVGGKGDAQRTGSSSRITFGNAERHGFDTGTRLAARTGDAVVYSQTADESYKRLTQQFAVPPGGGFLSFWVAYDTEKDWDFLFVEARSPGGDDWTTLPDVNGHTSEATGLSCARGWVGIHPQLAHYQTWDGEQSCIGTGTTGTWQAASGSSDGWQEWSVDLSAYAGDVVEVSIAYVSDWTVQGTGVFVDDVTLPDGTATSFEGGLDGWEVAAPPLGTTKNANSFVRTSASGCEPQAYTLTGLTSEVARVRALSDSGWAVGWSEGHAVAWRDPTHIIDTGIGGTTQADGRKVYGDAVDVNEAGLVAINRTAYLRNRLVSERALLWSVEQGATRLRGTPGRPRAAVASVNDHGVAVGWIRGPGKSRIPVLWRDGTLRRLPIPRGAAGQASDNNNRGLIVGYVVKHGYARPWTWHINGTNRPLRVRDRYAEASAVDDYGRVIGWTYSSADSYSSDTLLWLKRTVAPTTLFRGSLVTDLHDTGFMSVNSVDFRAGVSGARIGNLRQGGVDQPLPDPSGTDYWDSTFAAGVARGPSGFAPQGGVTVVGEGLPTTGQVRAIVWTCTQSHLLVGSRG